MPAIYTVSELNCEIKTLLESQYAHIRVRGELSGVYEARSRHCYFTLKDETATIRCAWFRNHRARRALCPEDGMEVIADGQLSLYSGRGDYQLIVHALADSGEGALQRKFQALQHLLAEQGLFDAHAKQELPRYPRTIGIITSAGGAVVHDILHTLARRNAAISVLVYETPVQGGDAAAAIAASIARAERERRCDVLILARGGGSLEDLWAFNEEVVARAMFRCRTPVVTGIGHETDHTIADLVADRRAATPTAAAELTACELHEQLRPLSEWQRRATSLVAWRLGESQSSCVARQQAIGERVHSLLRDAAQAVDGYQRQLPDVTRKMREDWHRFTELRRALGWVVRDSLRQQQLQTQSLHARLAMASPFASLRYAQQELCTTVARLHRACQVACAMRDQQLRALGSRLVALGPTAVLQRGYAIVEDHRSGRVLTDASEVEAGHTVRARLARGALSCTVDAKECE